MFTFPDIGRSSLFRGASITLAIKAFGLFAGLAMHFVVAKQMSASDYGVFAFVLSFAMLGSVVGRFALDTSIVRILTKSMESRQFGLVKGGIIWAVCTVGLFTLLVAVVTVVYRVLSNDPEVLHAIPLFVGISYTLLAQGILRVLGRNALAFSPDMIGRPFFTTILILISSVFGLLVNNVLLIHSFVSITMMIVSWMMVMRELPMNIRDAEVKISFIDWTSIATPVFLSTFVFVAEIHLTILMANWMLDSEAAGTVSLCIRLAALASLATVAMHMYLAPVLAKHYERRQTDELERVARNASLLCFAPMLIAISVYELFGGEILGLFGTEYAGYGVLLVLFTFSRMLDIIFGPINILMHMAGMERANATVTSIGFIFFVLACIAFVPRYELLGLAIITCVVTAIRQGVSWWLVRGQLNITSGVLAALQSRYVRQKL